MHFVLLGSSSSSSALATRSGSSEETLNKTSIKRSLLTPRNSRLLRFQAASSYKVKLR